MHQLIRIIVHAVDNEDATGIAQGLFDGQNAPLIGPYDYGVTMDDEWARWRGTLPEVIQETGSIRANTDDGMELIENAWRATVEEFKRNMAVIRMAVAKCDDEELLDDPRVEAEVDPWSPFGLVGDEDDYPTTYETWFRFAAGSIGEYHGSSNWLYNEHGTAIRETSEYEDIITAIEEEDDESTAGHYVVPVDVHY